VNNNYCRLKYSNLISVYRKIVCGRVHRSTSPSGVHATNSRYRSLPVDFDIFFAAATGDCGHDANTDHNQDSDQGPCCADAGQNTHFPECGEKVAHQDNKANQINTCLLHEKPPDKIRPLSDTKPIPAQSFPFLFFPLQTDSHQPCIIRNNAIPILRMAFISLIRKIVEIVRANSLPIAGWKSQPWIHPL
jgi:hypothetical protein